MNALQRIKKNNNAMSDNDGLCNQINKSAQSAQGNQIIPCVMKPLVAIMLFYACLVRLAG